MVQSTENNHYSVKGSSLSVVRLMDVNLNRCREGLRVLEDTARLVCNQTQWFKEIRFCRHQLDLLTRSRYLDLVASRQSQKDPGRSIAEKKRSDIQSIIYANFRRCEESLRVLEEYGKLFEEDQSVQFKALRFKIYSLEKKVISKIQLGQLIK